MGGKLKRLGLAVCVLLACSGMDIWAAVYAVPTPTAAADVVYVAGNPDCYPLEYYDALHKTYAGVFPELLARVSEETGISFVYISAGQENRQETLAHNRQVELVTAVHPAQMPLAKMYPVISFAVDGTTETYGIGFTSIASEDLRQAVTSVLAQVSEAELNALLRAAAKDSEPRVGMLTLDTEQLLLCAGGAVLLFTGIFFVRWRRIKKKQALERMTDALTGVGNSAYYSYFYDTFLEKGARDLYNIAYIGLDMARAAQLLERAQCEKLQCMAADVCKEQLAQPEALVRMQEGVFVLVFQAAGEQEMYERLDQIVLALNRRLEKAYAQVCGLAAAGVCHLRDHPGYDSACAYAHAKGGYVRACERKQLCCCGSEQQLVANKRRAKLTAQLREALKNGEFQFYFQAIVDGSTDTMRVCGAGLFSRWQHPEYGLLRPQEYLALLRENGRMQQFDGLAFVFACRQLEQWCTAPYEALFLNCKLSRGSLAQPEFVRKMETLADSFCFSRSRLVIEVVDDGVTCDRGLLAANLFQCRKLGFRIAVQGVRDGGGFFSDLYDNVVDFVTIDQAVAAGCVSERRHQMLADFIALAHRAGAQVIGQGVEMKRQQELMREAGCEMQQGYYYAHAVPEEEFSKLCS